MDANFSPTISVVGPTPVVWDHLPFSWRREAPRLLLVMFLALLVRSWVVGHTEVTARDSIGFIRYALHLDEPPLADDPADPARHFTREEVLKRSLHPPGYPAAIAAMSYPVRAAMGGTTENSMVLSAQLVSVFAAVLLVIPLYFFARHLTDPSSAWIATGMFALLPAFVQISSDGLSDSLYLLMVCSATLAVVCALKYPSGWRFLLAGALCGGAYLVRPEGLLPFGVAVLVLIGIEVVATLPGTGAMRKIPALCLGLVLVAGPYMFTIGRLTNKTTGNDLIQMLKGERDKPSWQPRVGPGSAGVSRLPVAELPLGVWWSDTWQEGSSKALWASTSLIGEMMRESMWIVVPLGLFGLWRRRREFQDNASFSFLTLLMIAQTGLLWYMAYKVGYVAGRHTILVVMLLMPFAAQSIVGIAERMSANRTGLKRRFGPEPAAIVAFVAVLAICLPPDFRSLHTNRAGHHAAGLWLKDNMQPGDLIWDPFCWAEFYAGQSMRTEPNPNIHAAPVYVVLEPGNALHSRLPKIPLGESIAGLGEPVWHWPTANAIDRAKVVVYRTQSVPAPPPWEKH